jgi:cyclophilin family peptidyl-prolyl cis-trans isomerase
MVTMRKKLFFGLLAGTSFLTALGGCANPSVVAKNKPEAQVILHTVDGDIRLKLYPSVAPRTVAQFIVLVQAGAYDTTHFVRIEPGFVIQTSTVHDRLTPLSESQKALVHNIPAEFSALKHRRGILSMAHYDNDINSGESSFSILLGDAPHLDGQYTIFGEVESGMDVVAAIEKTPLQANRLPDHRITITQAEVLPSSK